MTNVPQLNDSCIESLSCVIVEHEGGLTHTQIREYLCRHGIEDSFNGENKTRRLGKALLAHRQKVGSANNILALIKDVMAPVRFIDNRELYDSFRAKLNTILSFASLMIRDDGQLIIVDQSHTLDEAEERASRLRKKLADRKIHSDVIACCKTELVRDNNYFHAVLEATKSVAQKIRNKTNLDLDGHDLVDAVLFVQKGNTYPLLAINKYSSNTEQSEQKDWVFS